MPFKNEFMVGTMVVLALLTAYGGTRFLQGVPLFGSGYAVIGMFEDAKGLTPGSAVRVNGVRVGHVGSVRLSPSAEHVIARLDIDPGIVIPRGAQLAVEGFAALGDVTIAIIPGPPGNAPLAAGDTLYAPPAADVIVTLQRDATGLLASAGTTLAGVEGLLVDTEGDLLRMLASLRAATATLEHLLGAEQARVAATLQHLEATSASVSGLTAEVHRLATTQADSVALAISNLNRTLEKADLAMHHLGETSAELDLALSRINAGEGSLGRLLNDPGLYDRLDSTLTHMNSIMGDFQSNPGKYLRELKLIRVF